MQTIQTRPELRQKLSAWRGAGERIAVVPTMGNLHDGHISLVRIAKSHADRVVVTLFVNPTQFGRGEDFATYPRTPEQDAAKLRAAGIDLLFAPDVATVYPFGIDAATRVSVPGLTDSLCGTGRPGHFDGVTSAIMRFFALLQPDLAVFGQKDYQQQLVIRRMVDDLGLPVEIVVGPVVREPGGLAMSSRNAFLNSKEGEIAARLYETLRGTASEIAAGNRDFGKLAASGMETLTEARQAPEYFEIRRAADLALPRSNCTELVVLAATRVGTVRLIDNVLVAAQ
ncbi:MAG: pantoate--beta-alanine ligase [Proteobacteria bacterium]|nr:pantoate--beta-alanine ligase [Pseudomonadota bacterium]